MKTEDGVEIIIAITAKKGTRNGKIPSKIGIHFSHPLPKIIGTFHPPFCAALVSQLIFLMGIGAMTPDYVMNLTCKESWLQSIFYKIFNFSKVFSIIKSGVKIKSGGNRMI